MRSSEKADYMLDSQDPLICGADFLLTNLNSIILVLSLILIFISFRKVRDPKTKYRVLWLYLNVVSFILPTLLFILSTACQPSSIACHVNSLLYAVPLTIVLTSILSFITLSYLVKLVFGGVEITNPNIAQMLALHSDTLKMKLPKIYLIDDQKPISFSSFGMFTNKIFFSVGLFELLTPKELEAVTLHELYHIKRISSFSKFSTYFLRFLSPMIYFADNEKQLRQEENLADSFAIKSQKTSKYLLSAKKKILRYENESVQFTRKSPKR